MLNAKETEFDIVSTNLKKDFDRYEKSEVKLPSQLQRFDTELKKLLRLLTEVSSNNKNPAAKGRESKERLNRFDKLYKQLKQRNHKFREQKLELDKAQLFKASNQVEITHMKVDEKHGQLMQGNLNIAQNIVRDAHEVEQGHNTMLGQLAEHRNILTRANDDVSAMRDDADTIARVLKTIRNRKILNKVILLSLAAFLILADLILLILKI